MQIIEVPLRKRKKWNKEKKKYEMVQPKIHLFAIEDNTSRFVTSFHISHKKDSDSTTDFLRKSNNHPRPRFIVTDDADSFKDPIDEVFNKGIKNKNLKKVKHIAITKSDPRFADLKSFNNLIERFFQTAKSRTKIVRKYVKAESIENLLYMHILNYNFTKPNMSLDVKSGDKRVVRQTPADMAGIGTNKGKKPWNFFDLIEHLEIK